MDFYCVFIFSFHCWRRLKEDQLVYANHSRKSDQTFVTTILHPCNYNCISWKDEKKIKNIPPPPSLRFLYSKGHIRKARHQINHSLHTAYSQVIPKQTASSRLLANVWFSDLAAKKATKEQFKWYLKMFSFFYMKEKIFCFAQYEIVLFGHL